MTVTPNLVAKSPEPPVGPRWMDKLAKATTGFIAWLYSSPNPQVKAYFDVDPMAGGNSPSGSEVDHAFPTEPTLHVK